MSSESLKLSVESAMKTGLVQGRGYSGVFFEGRSEYDFKKSQCWQEIQNQLTK